MSSSTLISIDLRADFGFFKKTDTNDGILLSYNMIHKPTLLGILGGIIGLSGYHQKGKFPEYYQTLNDIPIGIEPLDQERGNYQKTTVKYTNTIGYANADGNLLIEETMLIRPAYRCYLLLELAFETQAKLYEYLKAGKADYVPYFGKNEFQAHWLNEKGEVSFQEYNFEKLTSIEVPIIISSLFTIDVLKTTKDKKSTPTHLYDFSYTQMKLGEAPFAYFERLPVGFNEQLIQYEEVEYIYSTFFLKVNSNLINLYLIKSNDKHKYIQLHDKREKIG